MDGTRRDSTGSDLTDHSALNRPIWALPDTYRRDAPGTPTIRWGGLIHVYRHAARPTGRNFRHAELASCYMGGAGFINSSGAYSGASDLAEDRDDGV